MKLHILSFFIFISACTSAFAQTPYDVTNSNPNGVGSLLNAIRAANSVTSSTPHIKVIVNIDPIVLDTLPRITHDVDIDLRMPNGVQAKIVRMLNTSDTTNMKYCKRPLFNFACANFTFKNADLVDSAEAPYISQVDTFIYGYQLVKTDVWNSGVYLIKNVLFKTGSNSIALEANGNYLDSTNICTIDSCFFIGGKTEVKAIYTANIMGCDFGYNRASERKGCGVLGIGVIVRANVGNSGNRRNRFTGKAVTPTEFENVIGSGEVGKLYFRNNRFDLLQQYNRSIHLVHLPDYEFGSDTAGHSNYISGVIYIETCRKGTFRNNRFGYKLAPDGVTEVPDSSNFVAGVRLVGDAFECDTSNPAMPAVTFGGRLANEPNIGCNFFIGSDVGMTKINFLGNIIRRTKPPYSPDIRVFTPTAGAPVSYICDSIAHYQVFNKVINKRPPLIESMRLVRHKTVRINVRSYVKGDTLQFFGINADSANNPAGIFALDSLITTRYVTGAVDTANGTVQSFYLPYLSIGKFGRIGIIGTYRARSSALSVARIQLCAPVSVLSGSGPGSLPAAIACANSKPGIDTIYVPSGVTISLPGSVSITDTLGLLVDSTPYSHIVPASSTAGLHAETGSNASIIRGLYFHGFTNGEDGSGLLVNDNVKGIQIDSCIFTSSDNGLSIFGDNAIIRRCKFDSSVYSGIYIGSGQNNTIKNSDFLIGNDNEGITAVNTIGLIIGGDSVSSRYTFTGEFTAVSATDSRRITIAGNRFNNFNNDYSDIIYLNNSDSILIGGDSALYGNRFSNIESYTSGIIKGSEANHIEIKANTFSGNTITNVISFSDSRYLTIGDTAIGDSAAGYTANYKAGNVFTGNTCEEVLGLSNCRDGDINYNYFGIKRTGSDATAFHNTGATIVSISSSDEGPDRDICIGSWAGEGNKIYCSPSDSIIAISASKLAKGITVAGNTVIGGAYPYYSLFTGYRHVFPPKIYILDTIAGGGVYLRYKLAYYSLLPRHKFEFFRGSTASELAYSTNTIYVGSDSGTVLIASDAKPYILFSSTNSQGSTSEYGHIRFTACPDAEPALDTLTVRFGNGGVALSDSLRISVPAGYQMRVNVQNSAGTTWDNSGKYRFSLPGTWVFKVHYNKDTGCRFVRVYTYNIPEPSAPEVFSLRNASCPGTPDGSFRFRIRYDVIDSIRTGLSRGWYTLHTFTFLGTDADYWSTYQVSGLSESGYTLNVVTKGGQVLPVVPIDILSDPVSTELISIPYAACFYGSNPGIVKFKITYPPYSDTSAHIYSKPYLIIRSDFETLYEGLGRGYDVTDSVTLTGSYFPGINLTFKASALQTSSECGSCGAEVCRSYSFFTLEKPIVKLNAINPMISGETPQFIVCGNNSTFVNFSVSEILSEIGRSTLQAQKISYTLVSGITSTTNEYVYNGWLPGLVDTSPPFLLTAGNYTLSVSVIFDSTASVGFCSSDATINFIVKPAVTAANPVVSAFPASCLDSLLSNGRAVVSAQGMDVRSYKWYQMPDSLNEMRDGKIKGSIADSLMKGAYRVVVLSYEGCTYTTDFSIDLIKGPPAPVITLYTTDSCNVYASFKDTAYGMTEQNPYGYQVYWYLDSMSNNIFVAQPYLDEASDEMRSVLPTRLLPDSGMLYAVVYNNVPCVSRVSVGALYSKPLTPRTFHICITWGKPVIPPPAVVEDIVEPPISDLSVTAINAAVAACISASKQEASRSGLSCYDPTLYADVLKYSYKEPKTISTLYYYDRAGRLVATVPPNGIDSVAAKPHSRLDRPDYKPYASTYNYNTLGQAVSQNTPDGGLTRFVYSKTGRLRLSRDAEQAIQGN
ncbi:MAG: right-handed parallel beta-helix repeat-containing protein, partial [Bacteroidota bacterium]